jgi:hypothetical protein
VKRGSERRHKRAKQNRATANAASLVTTPRRRARRQLVSPATDDKLAEMSETEWTERMRENFERLTAIKPRRMAAVVVTMRDDGVSILEWVAHYRALGFNGIFVYSNDNRDGSEALLAKLAQLGIITFIENRTSGSVSPQQKAFAHSIHKLAELRDFEWVFYSDSDEFLCFAPRYKSSVVTVLQEVAARFSDRPPTAIVYHWKHFVSGNVYARTPGLLLGRFQHGESNSLFKSIVRLSNVTSMRLLHFPEVRTPGFFVDSNLRLLAQTASIDKVWRIGMRTPRYAGGHIRHYWNKSFQEFAIKKLRGDALTLEANNYRREFDLFFDWNSSEREQNFDPPDESLLGAVERELACLRALPGVQETEQHIQDNFLDLLRPLGGDRALRKMYEGMLRRRSSKKSRVRLKKN